jgi:hypothetical protein
MKRIIRKKRQDSAIKCRPDEMYHVFIDDDGFCIDGIEDTLYRCECGKCTAIKVEASDNKTYLYKKLNELSEKAGYKVDVAIYDTVGGVIDPNGKKYWIYDLLLS